jgi:hypothetical protein
MFIKKFTNPKYRYLGGLKRYDVKKKKIIYNILKHGMLHLLTKDLI